LVLRRNASRAIAPLRRLTASAVRIASRRPQRRIKQIARGALTGACRPGLLGGLTKGRTPRAAF